jgi:uncharacterized RDD family membrane protein YckC
VTEIPPGVVAPPGFSEPSFGQRLGGALVDMAVLAGPALLAAALLSPGPATAVGLVLSAAYFIAMHTRDGRTVGKRLVGTRLVDQETGAVPAVGPVATRWLAVAAGSILSLLVPGGEGLAVLYTLVVLVPVLSRPLHQGLHDRVAATVVTRAG